MGWSATSISYPFFQLLYPWCVYSAEYIAKAPHSAKYSISYSAEYTTFYPHSAEYSTKPIISLLLQETSKTLITYYKRPASKTKSSSWFRQSASLFHGLSSWFLKTTLIISLLISIFHTIWQDKKCFAMLSFHKLIVSLSYMNLFR